MPRLTYGSRLKPTRAIGAESRQRMLTEVNTGKDLCPMYSQSAEVDFRL